VTFEINFAPDPNNQIMFNGRLIENRPVEMIMKLLNGNLFGNNKKDPISKIFGDNYSPFVKIQTGEQHF